VNLVDGNVLITGATGGIGQALARAFAAKGANLILTGRRADTLSALADELGARGIPCDLSDRTAVESLAREASDAQIDVFVSNAGLPGSGQLTDFTLEQVDRVLEVNLRAAVALTHALLPGMVERGRGHLVFISSLQGRAPTPGASPYVATKFALRGFSLALRDDLRPHNIGVSVIFPGFIRDAGMHADAGVKLPPGVGTRPPEAVAAAVFRAIEHNRAEIDVAPLTLRLGATFASLAPQTAAAVSRLMGSERIAAKHAEGQRDKR
jgi:short-subunit dehydrogenase